MTHTGHDLKQLVYRDRNMHRDIYTDTDDKRYTRTIKGEAKSDHAAIQK